MGFDLNSVVGRGSKWPSAFEDSGVLWRQLPVDAAGQPLFLSGSVGLTSLRTLDEIAKDLPELPGIDPGLFRMATVESPIALIGAEFFAGSGFQWAAAWAGGRLVFGPLITASNEGEADDERFVVAHEVRDMAINQLLRWIGVEALDGHDEFDSAVIDESHQPRQ